jgi:2-amino-4-hydroxy-6-hydroxymethyldihydropteridine diphosphokinase
VSIAVILLGSNIGDRANYLQQAAKSLEDRVGDISQKSSIYETVPWGFEAETNFYNQILILETNLPPQQILSIIQFIEAKMGRIRNSSGYTSRTIDIDILFYNDLIFNSPDLNIPHLHIHERKFVLEPLNEIIPDYIHPVMNKSIKELLSICKDKLKVVKI